MCSDRSALIDAFIVSAGWANARRMPLAGDASFRRYERIVEDERQAVLMDAPPDQEDIRPFVQVANELLGYGMSAPAILAQDEQAGFLLLEDLGDDLFTRVLQKGSVDEPPLYKAATDVLTALYRQAETVDYNAYPAYDQALYTREYALFSEWFLPAVLPRQESERASASFHAIWQELLAHIPPLRPVLVLRDYHADNLLWLPQREGVQKVGLLDFQDAVIGSPAYDMVSFLEDARRDVRQDTVDDVIEYYLQETGIDKSHFMAAYALLGAQRNCKIIGIFTRLAVRDGKEHYLHYLPRVWRHLERDLLHPLLAPLKVWMDNTIPASLRGIIETSALTKAAL